MRFKKIKQPQGFILVLNIVLLPVLCVLLYAAYDIANINLTRTESIEKCFSNLKDGLSVTYQLHIEVPSKFYPQKIYRKDYECGLLRQNNQKYYYIKTIKAKL